jgi:transcriptional regulator with XRE-family HTH domain
MRTSCQWESSQDEKERRAVKIVLLRRGLKVRDLARMTGRTPALISNLLCGNDPHWPGRAAVNKALGLPLFSNKNRPRRPILKRSRRLSRAAIKKARPAPAAATVCKRR